MTLGPNRVTVRRSCPVRAGYNCGPGGRLDAKTLLIAAMVTLTVVFLTRWFVVARARAGRR